MAVSHKMVVQPPRQLNDVFLTQQARKRTSLSVVSEAARRSAPTLMSAQSSPAARQPNSFTTLMGVNSQGMIEYPVQTASLKQAK
ncbi:hypothetical protein HCU64_23890 [Methylobacterium sp. C25]|uniref:hypothetical protein n=1 Tax=Methylobacterium sp. C25 TaxID=2721622 RepID=UPI001F3C7627|nr:hypothetical protein [Methylobacterium sp. C25]MCE4226785.1 hypothetical protein [Methylobacterium sp. C25]